MVRGNSSSPWLLRLGEGQVGLVVWWLRGGQRPGGTEPKPPPPGTCQACAPLYSWRTEKDPQSDPVGTCYLATKDFTHYLEYAPCRSGRTHGFCLLCASESRAESPHTLISFCVLPLGPPPPPVPSSLFASSPMTFSPCRFQLCGRSGLLPRGLQRRVHQGES